MPRTPEQDATVGGADHGIQVGQSRTCRRRGGRTRHYPSGLTVHTGGRSQRRCRTPTSSASTDPPHFWSGLPLERSGPLRSTRRWSRDPYPATWAGRGGSGGPGRPCARGGVSSACPKSWIRGSATTSRPERAPSSPRRGGSRRRERRGDGAGARRPGARSRSSRRRRRRPTRRGRSRGRRSSRRVRTRRRARTPRPAPRGHAAERGRRSRARPAELRVQHEVARAATLVRVRVGGPATEQGPLHRGHETAEGALHRPVRGSSSRISRLVAESESGRGDSVRRPPRGAGRAPPRRVGRPRPAPRRRRGPRLRRRRLARLRSGMSEARTRVLPAPGVAAPPTAREQDRHGEQRPEERRADVPRAPLRPIAGAARGRPALGASDPAGSSPRPARSGEVLLVAAVLERLSGPRPRPGRETGGRRPPRGSEPRAGRRVRVWATTRIQPTGPEAWRRALDPGVTLRRRRARSPPRSACPHAGERDSGNGPRSSEGGQRRAPSIRLAGLAAPETGR